MTVSQYFFPLLDNLYFVFPIGANGIAKIIFVIVSVHQYRSLPIQKGLRVDSQGTTTTIIIIINFIQFINI